MKINMKLDTDFTSKIMALDKKYGEEFTKMNGFHSSNLNFTEFIDNFTKDNNNDSSLADFTIDPNSNNSMKDLPSMMREMNKAHSKLLSYNKIYFEMKKKYGIEQADLWIEKEWNGEFYLHNSHNSSFIPYCYAFSVKDIAERGLFFLGKFKTTGAKHLDTFNNHVLEFISYASNRISGACGLADVLIWQYYFYKSDKKNNYLGISDFEKYRDQQFQTFIYNLNQPYLRQTESAFTNVTIYDREYLVELFGTLEFPDGTFGIEQIEEIMLFQRAFMKVVSDIRSTTVMTFPVLTISLLYQEGKFVDEETARWANKHNMEWYDSNFYIGDSITALSSCCFSEDEKVFVIDENGKIEAKRMIEVEKDDIVRLIGKNGLVKAKKVEYPNAKMLRMKTHNGQEILSTHDHIHRVLRKNKVLEIPTSEVRVGDQLCFNENGFSSQFTGSKYIGSIYDSYDFGKLIGMTIGDGSISENNGYYSVRYCLNYTTKAYLKDFLLETLDKIGLTISEHVNEGGIGKATPIYNVIMKDYPNKKDRKDFIDMIRNFISGNTAHEKALTDECLNMSEEFRNGIVDGYYETDGGNSNRIYSVNKELIDSFGRILSSLALSYNIDTDAIKKVDGKLSDNIVYCIRYYAKTKNTYMDMYSRHKKDGLIYFKITSICEDDTYTGNSHCFEIIEGDPYFTLANGVYTHNCRVINDFSEMDTHSESLGFINSIGGTSLKVGSVQVNTTNLARLALEANGNFDTMLMLLDRNILLSLNLLDTIRHIIKRNIEKGLLPMYNFDLIDMNRQFSTLGITGMYSAISTLGGIDTDELGNKFYTEKGREMACLIMDRINGIKKDFTKDYLINLEAVPGESCNVKSARKDTLLYGFDKVGTNLYGNQWIPLTEKCTNKEKIELSALLDRRSGGGAIGHYNIESRFATEKQSWDMLNYIAKKGVIYFAYNIKISACEDNHGFFGETCHCGKPAIETYSRVVGFIVPSSSFSKERKQEFENRLWYKID